MRKYEDHESYTVDGSGSTRSKLLAHTKNQESAFCFKMLLREKYILFKTKYLFEIQVFFTLFVSNAHFAY